MVVALGRAYAHFGELPWMQAAFYGAGAAVVGIIAMIAYRLTTKTIGKNGLLCAIYLTIAMVTVVTQSEIVWLFIAGGPLNWCWRAPPKWLGKGGLNALAATQMPVVSGILSGLDLPVLGQIGLFFTKPGAFLFGSVLAIVPFLYGGVATDHQWLNDKQFVDAVAVAIVPHQRGFERALHRVTGSNVMLMPSPGRSEASRP